MTIQDFELDNVRTSGKLVPSQINVSGRLGSRIDVPEMRLKG
jgi:hypothetical protein